MKKTLGIACAAALVLCSAATATADPPSNLAPYMHQARSIWRCWAHSRVAYGYSAWVYSLAVAKAQALTQCAVRTPRGMMCYVTSCQ